jgi:ectoine hydroxylase-related dioxygenase (phytanoyl-CoA dioxygenase family)
VLRAYADDGVAVYRQALGAEWIERMQRATERVIQAPTGIGSTYADPKTGGAFSHDLFLWRHDDDFRALAMDSPLPAIAREVIGTDRLQLFFDQLLVKEPGLRMPIAWHQDLTTFPLTGSQVVSIWIPFDPADSENGVVNYVPGSHRWGRTIRDLNYAEAPGDADLPDPSTFETVSWSLEPGDVVLHHPLTVHGSQGNRSATARRRALSIRYAGDDIRFQAKEPNFMSNLGLPLPDLADGDRLDAERFPVLFS